MIPASPATIWPRERRTSRSYRGPRPGDARRQTGWPQALAPWRPTARSDFGLHPERQPRMSSALAGRPGRTCRERRPSARRPT
jgi:hypothetical protein